MKKKGYGIFNYVAWGSEYCVTTAYITLSLLLTSQGVARAGQEKGAERLFKPLPVSFVERIPKEANHPQFARLASQYHKLSFQTRMCDTQRDGKALRVAVHQLACKRDQVLVLIHGILSDHETWRYIAGELAEGYDLWLVDLPGCGSSDAPSPRHLGQKGYSPTAMADRLLQALRQCLAERPGSVKFSIVAHSLGGLVSTQMTSDPDLRARYGDVLQHLQRMVLFAPADVVINQENPVFVKIAKLHGFEITIGKVLQVLDYATAKAGLNGVCETNLVVRETSERLARVLATGERRLAAQAMIRQAVNWNEREHRPDWDANKKLEANYANIDVPCLIVWGERDETLPESMGHKLKDHIPGAKLLELPHCMHSPQSECPEDALRIIKEFNQDVPRIAEIKTKDSKVRM